MSIEDATAPNHARRRPHQLVGRAMCGSLIKTVVLMMVLLLVDVGIAMASNNEDDMPDNVESVFLTRLKGMQALFGAHPRLLVSMVVRVAIAIALQVNLDAFLKLVVTPFLAASIIGAAAAPFTFFVGQALQPIINSACFLGFDDKFVVAALEATGGKGRLVALGLSKTGEWRKMGFFYKYFVKGLLKVVAGCVVGVAGLCSAIPVAGPVLTALLSGWIVAWDVVFVPLYGMGHAGVAGQWRSVHAHWREYHWFGFWAVLLEEIPVVNPACHVYNVYSAAFFLESVYLTSNATELAASTVEGLIDGMGEL